MINAESAALVICACLPLVRPVLSKMTDMTIGSVRRLTSLTSSSSSRTTSQKTTRVSKMSSSISKGQADDEVELNNRVIHCRQDYIVTEEVEIEDSPPHSMRGDSQV
jgi:hypothetical protein